MSPIKTIILAALNVALMGPVLTGCSESKAPVAAPVEVAASAPEEPKAPAREPTDAQKVDAVARAWDRNTKTCLDTLRKNTFFVHFKEDDEGENLLRGWYLVAIPEFYEAANNTWFITDVSGDKFTQIFPDTNGMLCRTK